MAYNNSDSSSTRSNKANHGGGPSNIFSHYQEQEDEEVHLRRAAEIERVKQGVYQTESEQTNSDNYNRAKDDFAANRARNQGAGAPFALGNNMVDSPPPRRQPRSVEVEPVAVQDGRGGDFAANRARNLGNGAPFATGESMVERRPVRQNDPPHQYVPENGDYRTPKEKQAGNRNLNRNTFQDLFGTDEGEAADHNRSRGKASTHNPVTWEAYSNYDAEADKPAHRSRYENSAKARQGQGGFNPLNPGAAPPEDLTRRSARGAHPAASTISNVTF